MTQKPDWKAIDENTLSPKEAALYGQWIAAKKAAASAKAQFETEFLSKFNPPQGKRVIIGALYGKLSVALVDSDGRRSDAKPKLSLADFLSQSREDGRLN